jgi:hypothetical protein
LVGLFVWCIFVHLFVCFRSIDRFQDVSFLIAPGAAAGGRLILSPTAASLRADASDVRLFSDAAKKAALRAKSAGATSPLVVVLGGGGDGMYRHAVDVALLSVLAALYVGLQARGERGGSVGLLVRLFVCGSACAFVCMCVCAFVCMCVCLCGSVCRNECLPGSLCLSSSFSDPADALIARRPVR